MEKKEINSYITEKEANDYYQRHRIEQTGKENPIIWPPEPALPREITDETSEMLNKDD